MTHTYPRRQWRGAVPAPFGRWGGLLLALVVLLSACTAEDETGAPADPPPVSSNQSPAGNAAPGGGVGVPVVPAPGGRTMPPSLPAAGGVGVEKVDAVFLQLLTVYQVGGADAARAFARMQGLLTANDEVRMTLVLDTNEPSVVEGSALAVGRLGGRVTATYGSQIEMVVPVETLVEYSRAANRQSFFADLSGFRHVKDVRRTPTATGQQAAVADVTAAKAPTTGGATRSEGVEITGAAAWHAAGITGRNVKVGVIDIGFTNYAAVLGTERVVVRSFREDGKTDAPPGRETMHGTACAEIVREMAPGVELYLAAAGDTPGGFVTALNWLTRTAGVGVVTTSIGFSGDFPTDGSSDLARAVDEAQKAGVFFTKSAGNLAQQQYRATFTDANGDGDHDFLGAATANTLRVLTTGAPLRLWLNWDDWKQPRVNYDLFVTDDAGREVARSVDVQGRGGKRPVETVVTNVPAGTYSVRVRKVNSEDAPLPLTLIAGPGAALELTTADGTITVPGDARGSVTVGAVDWRDGSVPRYSSRGPTLDGRVKPDLGGPEGVSNAAYALVGPPIFHGTSAAAPHVAGAAALMREGDPAALPDTLLAALIARAAPLAAGQRGDPAAGAGRLALGAPPSPLRESRPVPVASPPAPPESASVRVLTRGASFADDFTGPTSGLPAPGYQDGGYRIVVGADALLSRLYPAEVATPDATYSVQARRVTGGRDAPMGLIVRAADRDNYLLFVATNDGTFNIFARVNGSLRALLPEWQTSDAIRRDGPNTLTVQATGTRFAFSVNGRPISVLEIPDVWMTGGFGFVGGGGTGAGGEIAFTNYRVTVP